MLKKVSFGFLIVNFATFRLKFLSIFLLIFSALILPLYPETVIRNAHSSWVNDVTFSPDGKIIASCAGNLVKLWNREGRLLHTLRGHLDTVECIAFSPDGTVLASGSSDRTVRLWTRDGKFLKELTGHNGRVFSVFFSPDGKMIASASENDLLVIQLKIWNHDGKLLNTIENFKSNPFDFAFTPDSKLIVASYGFIMPGGVNFWELSGEQEKSIRKDKQLSYKLVKDPLDRFTFFISIDSDRKMNLWDSNGNPISTFGELPNEVIVEARISKDGKMLAIATLYDYTIWLWSKNGELIETLKGGGDRVTGIAISPDGELLVSGHGSGSLRVWNIKAGKREATRTVDIPEVIPVGGLSFSHDLKYLAGGSWDNTVYLWALEGGISKGGFLWKKSGSNDYTEVQTRVLFGKKGSYIASSHNGNPIRLWNVSGKLIHIFFGQKKYITDYTFSNDDRFIAVSYMGEDGTNGIQLWTVEGDMVDTFVTGGEEIYSIAFSKDNRMLAGGGFGKVWLFSLEGRMKLLPPLKTDSKDEVHSTVFNEDGSIVSIGYPPEYRRGSVKCRIWNREGKLVREFVVLPPVKGGMEYLYVSAVSNDGKYIAVPTVDRALLVWSSDDKLVRSLEGCTDVISGLAFSEDGGFLAAGSKNGEIRIFNISTGDSIRLMAFASGNWLVVHDKSGRYDGSSGSENLISYILDSKGSVKARLTPGLLSKFMKGYADKP